MIGMYYNTNAATLLNFWLIILVIALFILLGNVNVILLLGIVKDADVMFIFLTAYSVVFYYNVTEVLASFIENSP
jgi:hypothetical protein